MYAFCHFQFPVYWGKNRHLYLLRRDAFSFHQVQFVIFVETQWHVSVSRSTGIYLINKALCPFKNKTAWQKNASLGGTFQYYAKYLLFF